MADRRGIETRLDRGSESGAGANVVVRGRLPNEPSLHVECAALPSDSVNANADADSIGADRMADLRGDSMSSSDASSDCARARQTAECRAAVGSDPDIVEQHTAAGDNRSSDTCAGFPPCDGMVNERPDHTEGAASPSSVMEESAATPSPVIVGGAVPPIDVADDIVSARDRVRARRSFYGTRRDSVSSAEGDTSVMMDDFGYIYDECTARLPSTCYTTHYIHYITCYHLARFPHLR